MLTISYGSTKKYDPDILSDEIWMEGGLLVGLKLDQLVEVWNQILRPLNFVSQSQGIFVPDSI